MNKERKLRDKIIKLTGEYFSTFHKKNSFKPGKDYINYSGRVFDEKE